MRTHQLGGRNVSVIGLGTADFGGKCPESRAREFLDAYTEIGGNLIDTARVYGDFSTPRDGESEKVIGRWMSERKNRADLFLSTKGGHPRLRGLRLPRLSRADILADMEASLEALQTDRVDIYWLHRDDLLRPVGEIMETLQQLIEDGHTRMTGVSNWKAGRIAEANAYAAAHGLTPLTADQPQFSLAPSRMIGDPTLVTMDRRLWTLHRDTGMPCFCFSSQAGGFYAKLDSLGAAKLPLALKAQYLRRDSAAVLRRLRELSAGSGRSVSALSLAWLTCQPFPTFALAGVSRPEHVRSLAEAGDTVLTDEERDSLRVFSPVLHTPARKP